MKKAIVLSIFLLLLLLFSFSAVQATLVPDEGRMETGDYKMSDIIKIFINIHNFILSIVGSLTLLFFVVGGIIMMVSHGNAEIVEKGKNTIKASLVGLVIVLFAFTFTNLLVMGLGYDVGTFGRWAQPSIDEYAAPGPEAGGIQEAAMGLLFNSENVQLDTRADCGGNNYAKHTLEQIAASEAVTACRRVPTTENPNRCVCDRTTTVNGQMIRTTYEISKNHKILITSITTGRHVPNSGHYRGNKIDIVPLGTADDWRAVMNEYNRIKPGSAKFEYYDPDGTRHITDYVLESAIGPGTHLDITF